MEPYYSDEWVTLWHDDARNLWDNADRDGQDMWDVLVTDPPFGIGYKSGHSGTLPRSIAGDDSTALRDEALGWWSAGYPGDAEYRPALVFGSWRAPRPEGTRQVLVWDTGGALGMGALDLPWKPAHQEVYVIGEGFHGRRTSDVLRFPPVQSMARNGRTHPHEKPVPLLVALLAKCPDDGGPVLDPFCGTGSSLVAAKQLGRRATGIEIEERYCEIAARRLSQEVLAFSSGDEL